jgi:hypothetical protein
VIDRSTVATRVYLELGSKRTFACALDWPGWCRSGKGETQALEALAAYAPRYALVAAEAGYPFLVSAATRFEVIDELAGNATTDFGGLAEIAERDFDPLDRDTDRFVSLVAAAWTVLDQIAANAPVELRKGPRGGGRNRDKIVEHLFGAEAAYARKLGVRLHQPEVGEVAAIASFREAILDGIRSAFGPPETSWPPRYAARRIAWHVLDHAWEIEDRSSPQPAG